MHLHSHEDASIGNINPNNYFMSLLDKLGLSGKKKVENGMKKMSLLRSGMDSKFRINKNIQKRLRIAEAIERKKGKNHPERIANLQKAKKMADKHKLI